MIRPAARHGRIYAFLALAALSALFMPPFLTARAAGHTVSSVPNARLVDASNHVSNPDGILAPQDVALINVALRDLEEKTGIEVAVVALDGIDGSDARAFATDLFNAWGIGKKGKDNGLLIQLVTEPSQRSVVFETGYGIEGALPDALCYRIQQRHMLPHMKAGDYSAGMREGVLAVRELFMRGGDESAGRSDVSASSGIRMHPRNWLPFFAVLAFMLAFTFFIYRAGWKICPACGRRRLRRTKYVVLSSWSALSTFQCSSCGHVIQRDEAINPGRAGSRDTDSLRNDSDSRSSGSWSGGSDDSGSSGGGSWGGGSSGGGGSISRF